MQYVDYGKTGLKVSRFGLGYMRLGGMSKTDAVAMARYAIDHGVNYIDTAYIYEGSEEILAKALKGGLRDKVIVASKAPMWSIETQADLEKYLDIQLKRLNTDFIDVYLLHNLYGKNWEKVQKLDGFTFLEDMVKKGKIGIKGFSAHCLTDLFREIVDSYPWEMAQVQLNILDVENQVGLEGLLYGASKGLAMVTMESLRGGGIINCMPQSVAALLDAYPEKRSLIEWAFRWLYDKPEVTVILSGTTSVEQVAENIRIFENARTGCMSEADQELIAMIRAEYEAQSVINCTACEYCMPCPVGVAIPSIFRLYNNFKCFHDTYGDKLIYSDSYVSQKRGADLCVACGSCETVCPQHLPIIESLKTAHDGMLIST